MSDFSEKIAENERKSTGNDENQTQVENCMKLSKFVEQCMAYALPSKARPPPEPPTDPLPAHSRRNMHEFPTETQTTKNKPPQSNVVAIVVPSEKAVAAWAEEKGISGKSYAELVRPPTPAYPPCTQHPPPAHFSLLRRDYGVSPYFPPPLLPPPPRVAGPPGPLTPAPAPRPPPAPPRTVRGPAAPRGRHRQRQGGVQAEAPGLGGPPPHPPDTPTDTPTDSLSADTPD